MRLTQLASRPNLQLAWRRIATGSNLQYKQIFRHLYSVYEVALDVNLRDLRQRILGETFAPRSPERIYVPKPSGFHRPISLLHIEDQIVLQAFANLAAKKVRRNRVPLQYKAVFSNILGNSKSIFFFRKWQRSYSAFQQNIIKQYNAGMRWVGYFDLAAFYETVSHELLLKVLYPRTANDGLKWVARCLRKWSSEHPPSGHGHGLPQGPLASDLLAECFLLPIDLALQKRLGYIRYVDDVRILGKTENEVREDVIRLERHCRERGLIPQIGKFAIRRCRNVQDAIGMIPSISDPQNETDTRTIGKKQGKKLFLSSIGGRPYRVTDKSTLRYVLFRAQPDTELLSLVIRLIPRHPEHADMFFMYLRQFNYRKPIERLCLDLIENNPYAYVRGEAWHVLARYRQDRHSKVFHNASNLIDKAITISKKRTSGSFVERWGSCHFLCVSEDLDGSRYSRFLMFQEPLMQAFLAPVLPDEAFKPGKLVETYLRRTTPEPGLSLCPAIHTRRVALANFGIQASDLCSQVANTLRGLGVTAILGPRVDPIAEALSSRYHVPQSKSWRRLLGREYMHALGFLKLAEASFDSGRSGWLTNQNSFNQVIFLQLQEHLNRKRHGAACRTIDKNGHLINFGVTLNASGPFSRTCQTIGDAFREMNTRRNRIPIAHPYEKKTVAQTRHLTAQEQNLFVTQLRAAYVDFVGLMPV